MQTFLPYPNIIDSVKCLDNKRLGKQRVEAYQILRALTGYQSRWINHPAVKMWKGFENCLAAYMDCCIEEWTCRGFKNTMLKCIAEPWNSYLALINEYPPWFGNEAFHNSHKSNLLRKMPEHYSQFGWQVPNDLPYIWPIVL